MTKQQRQRRITLWRKLAGARPAWIVTFALTIAGAVLTQWDKGMQRIASLERDVTHLAEQRAELKADMAAESEMMKRMVSRQCREVCAR